MKSKKKKTSKSDPETSSQIVDDSQDSEPYKFPTVSKPAPQRKTTNQMTIYEYSALIMTRALQLTSRNVVPTIRLIDPEDYDPLNIAKREVDGKAVSLIIRRTLPDGSIEDWGIDELEFPRK